MSNISAQMRDAVGSRLSSQVSYPVAASDIRKWAIAVYYPRSAPQRYLSTDEAGVVAPEEFNPFAWAVAHAEAGHELPEAAEHIAQNDPDRTEKTLGIAGPGLRFQLNGGIDISYGAPIRPGDVITGVTELAGYSERDGRLGTMLMTDIATVWTNQRGKFVRKAVNTLIRY